MFFIILFCSAEASLTSSPKFPISAPQILESNCESRSAEHALSHTIWHHIWKNFNLGNFKILNVFKKSNKSKKQDIYCNSFNKYRTCTGYIVFILIILSIIYVYKLEKRITSIGHNNIKFTNTCIIDKKLSHFFKNL